MHTGRLVLTPRDPTLSPQSLDPLIEQMRQIGLAGDAFDSPTNQSYLVGDDFFKWVNFMGCSPYIPMEPSTDGQPFCHVRFQGPLQTPVIMTGRNTRPPQCGQCGKPMADWQEACEDWINNQQAVSCSHCHASQSPRDLRWRKSAGMGRCFMIIEHIFPQEALPADGLMCTLEQATEIGPWVYFYIQD